MNDWERNHRTAQIYKDAYPPGTRVLLINNNDTLHRLPSGIRGTVNQVDDQGQIFVAWDNGSQRNLVPDVDEFRKLTQEEIDAELEELSHKQMNQEQSI